MEALCLSHRHSNKWYCLSSVAQSIYKMVGCKSSILKYAQQNCSKSSLFGFRISWSRTGHFITNKDARFLLSYKIHIAGFSRKIIIFYALKCLNPFHLFLFRMEQLSKNTNNATKSLLFFQHWKNVCVSENVTIYHHPLTVLIAKFFNINANDNLNQCSCVSLIALLHKCPVVTTCQWM